MSRAFAGLCSSHFSLFPVCLRVECDLRVTREARWKADKEIYHDAEITDVTIKEWGSPVLFYLDELVS